MSRARQCNAHRARSLCTGRGAWQGARTQYTCQYPGCAPRRLETHKGDVRCPGTLSAVMGQSQPGHFCRQEMTPRHPVASDEPPLPEVTRSGLSAHQPEVSVAVSSRIPMLCHAASRQPVGRSVVLRAGEAPGACHLWHASSTRALAGGRLRW